VLRYAVVEAPFSALLLLASQAGLKRVVFLKGQHPEEWLAEHIADEAAPGLPEAVGEIVPRLQAYLGGVSETFEGIPLDLSGATPFQHRVWDTLRKVPYGSVVTYAELAWRIGNPRAARAVGNAVGANRLPIVIPCHRVVASRGIGGFGDAGVAIKRALLQLEGVTL